MTSLPITRSTVRILPDPSRVIVKSFAPGEFASTDGDDATAAVVQRVLALPESEVVHALAGARVRFGARHPDLDVRLAASFDRMKPLIAEPDALTPERRLLVGACFIHEYAVEAAALTNPSIVPAPDQSGLEFGELRFVMSLRAIGEGHRSSVELRSGVVGADGGVAVDNAGGHLVTGDRLGSDSITFPPDSDISERVLYPGSADERQGMEDARFVRFVDDDRSVRYLATYTAFDGSSIHGRLLETDDFVNYRVARLEGVAAQDKGLAIFPRKLDCRYVALSRHDDEGNHIAFSDDLQGWREPRRIQVPKRPWELIKLGNCGSPMETDAGWLVLTHGVGLLREYALGAILLDRHEPWRVVGRLDEPLLTATEAERDGYVPNVVYSCGSLIHRDQLVIPYGFSDRGTAFATVRLDDLLERLS
jgi:predicted GH43/DUF377 family glycosyl hydrolase